MSIIFICFWNFFRLFLISVCIKIKIIAQPYRSTQKIKPRKKCKKYTDFEIQKK